MKVVKMLATAAFPDAIYHEGKSYRVSDELAEKFIAVGSGKQILGVAAELVTGQVKTVKPQSPPDPGEVKSDDIEDDDDTE